MFALLLQKRLWRTLPGCRLNLNHQLIRLCDCRKLWTDWDSCQAPRASPDLSWRLDVEPNPKLAPSVRPDSAPVVDLLEDLDLDRLEDEVLDSMTLMERQRQLLFLTQVVPWQIEQEEACLVEAYEICSLDARSYAKAVVVWAMVQPSWALAASLVDQAFRLLELVWTNFLQPEVRVFCWRPLGSCSLNGTLVGRSARKLAPFPLRL